MKKDIAFHIAEKIQIVAIREWDKEFLSQDWHIYLINDREDTIETVLVMSRGNSDTKKTSILRHGLGDLSPKSYSKVELITEEVLEFTNEYLVTFFAEGKLFERSFVFEPNSISTENMVRLPVIQAEGIRAK